MKAIVVRPTALSRSLGILGRAGRNPVAGVFALGALLLVCVRGFSEGAEASAQVLTQNTFVEIAEKTLPSVVAVYVSGDIRDQMKDMHGDKLFDDPNLKEFFKEFKGEDDQKVEEDPRKKEMFQTRTSGSGVILTTDGYIVTNLHIVKGAKPGTISVVLNDDTEIPSEKVKVMATDEYIDLAVLKIDSDGLDLKPITWGDSDKMRIGDWVVAIGNPLDLRGSVSSGIISAKARKIYKVDIEHLIQTDTMINPGNSGGALVNLKGELIGINMAIATNSGFFQGIGFAIPSKDARFVTDQVISQGKVKRGYIGIEMLPMTDELRESFGLKKNPRGGNGVVVSNVIAGAPADKAGVKPYDVIVGVDGIKIDETRDLLGSIAGKSVGDSANLEILREVDGKISQLSLPMKVTERPPDEELNAQRSVPVKGGGKKHEQEDSIENLGLFLKPYSQEGVKGLEVQRVAADSPAQRAGIVAGDILLEVNRHPVATLEDYEKALQSRSGDAPHLLRLFQDGRRVFATVEPPKKEK